MKEDKKEKTEDFQFQSSYQKKYENIKKLLYSAFSQLERVQNALENLEQEERKAHYKSIPGTEGVFDGKYLIAQDGRKTEVPENYAAKSRLVYGDVLKVFNESGKQIFKQIDRVERKKIEGVLAKKEGKWYLLSDSGSYKISDAFADFNSAQLNDKASAYIPADILEVPFATLDKIYKEGGAEEKGPTGKSVVHKSEEKNVKKVRKPTSSAPIKSLKKPKKEEAKTSSVSKGKIKTSKGSFDIKKKENAPEKAEESHIEYVDNILEDDDLR